jgi:hypothetical protein
VKVEELEVVFLAHDIPEYKLKAGDIGTIVGIFPGGHIEVEFVKPTGQTRAVLSLTTRDIKKTDENDVLSVRHAAQIAEIKRKYKV